jgi:hypothetical protein
MAAMTQVRHRPRSGTRPSPDAPPNVVPLQRDRRGRRPAAPKAPVTVVRICTDRPIGASVLLPVAAAGASIAPLLPIRRDRRARRARRGTTRRMTVLAVAFGVSLLMWVAIIGGVLALARTL